MKASVVTCRDPFRPANHRSVDIVRRRRSLRNLAPRTQLPVICQVNGQWMPRKAWSRRVADGDLVVFMTLPQGGGGGGSNPLRAVLMIAVMVFAAWAAPAIGTVMGVGTFGTGVIQGAIGLVGSALINALIPAAKPAAASAASSLAAASPTYSIGSQGNSARIGQPIPVIYGRHLIYPDFAAQPYTEYAGNEQYLYELFCIGQGYYDIETIRIEDTPIGNFAEVTTEIVQPGGTVTLFPTRVITSGEVSGQEAVTGVWIGGFVANDSGTAANAIAVDVVMPRGLYRANDDGSLNGVDISWVVQALPIDDYGAATGAWFTIGSENVWDATTTPIRLSYRYSVPAGRYQVRLMRTDTKQTDSRYGHELNWAGLRAYLPGSQQYGDVTMLAVRMRATNNLSAAASRKINLVVTRKLPVWNGSSWSSPIATRSIAWALADICRAQYGGKQPDARIGINELLALNAIWSTRGDTFNFVFDSQSTVGEALTIAARAGRAVWYKQGGIVHFVRDQPATLPVALFTPRNIVKSSLSIDYLMTSEETADAIDVTYFDETVWTERTVRAALPGSAQSVVASMKLPGVTSRAQAWKEGMYAAACNRYRRRLPSWQTEMEGFVPTIGDLVALSHDMPQWGQSGEIVAWNAATKTATLSEPLTWTSGMQHMLAFRGRAGDVIGPYYAMAGADAYHVVLTDWALSGVKWSDGVTDKATPDTGGDRERSHFAFGPATTQYIRARLLAMRPRSTETVELAAVIESDYVHTADTGAVPPASAWQLPTKITRPIVSGLAIVAVPFKKSRMLVSWQPAAGADRYYVEQSDGSEAWHFIDDVRGTSIETDCPYFDRTVVRVAAIGITRGPWAYFSYADYLRVPPSDVSSFTLDGNILTWSSVPDLDIDGYRIRFQHGVNTEWGTAVPMHDGLLTSSPYTMLVVPSGRVTIMIRAVDTMGNESQRSAYIITDLGDVSIANVLESYDYRAAGFPGSITNGTVIDGDLAATQSDPFYKADLSDFYGEAGAPFYSVNYDGMTWESTPCTAPPTARGESMVVDWSATGEALRLEYRPTGPSPLYGSDLSPFYGVDSEPFYDAPPDWMVWPGSIAADGNAYQWRVRTSTGPTPGVVSSFSVVIDVPDRTLSLSSVSIASGGSRLSAAAGLFRVIKSVQLTLESGSSAVRLEIVDRSAELGPLVVAKDASGAYQSAVADATIQGY